jgi:hypothetical protein
MTTAATDPTSLRRAPDVGTAAPAPQGPTTATGSDVYEVWDNEGGSPASDGAHQSHHEVSTGAHPVVETVTMPAVRRVSGKPEPGATPMPVR